MTKSELEELKQKIEYIVDYSEFIEVLKGKGYEIVCLQTTEDIAKESLKGSKINIEISVNFKKKNTKKYAKKLKRYKMYL